jgi:hypothetical protein
MTHNLKICIRDEKLGLGMNPPTEAGTIILTVPDQDMLRRADADADGVTDDWLVPDRRPAPPYREAAEAPGPPE